MTQPSAWPTLGRWWRAKAIPAMPGGDSQEGQMNLMAKSIDKGSAASNLFTAPASPDRSRASRWLQEQLKRARREGVFTITAELTPELAELLLDSNPANRSFSAWKAVSYARDIRNGMWCHNGETIIVAASGELNDGQHRCNAVIDAGRSIVTEITFGVERDSRHTVDTGMKRTVGQHLGMRGHTDANNLAYAVALILRYQRSGRFNEVDSTIRPTTAEIIEWIEKNGEIMDHVRLGGTFSKFRQSNGLFAALHYVLSGISEVDAGRFFEALKTGENLSRTSPIYRLREKLQDAAAARKRLSANEVAAAVILAWNAFRTKRGVKSFSLKPDDTFPKPV